jgi:hypothetical protein
MPKGISYTGIKNKYRNYTKNVSDKSRGIIPDKKILYLNRDIKSTNF